MGALLFTSEEGNSAIACCAFWSDFVTKPDTYFAVVSLVETINNNMSILLSTESKQLQQEQSTKQTKRKSDKVEMGPREKIEFHEATNSETCRENIRGAFSFFFFLSFFLSFWDLVPSQLWRNTVTLYCTLPNAWHARSASKQALNETRNKWFDCECGAHTKKEKKHDARRAVNRFKRTKSDAGKLICRQKRAEHKSNVTEEKQHYKTSVQFSSRKALSDNKRNISTFWDTVRMARRRKT